jgi:hypothetical protein
MNTTNTLDLNELLPVLYRLRDAEQNYPLRSLLELISQQAGLIKTNIDELWDDMFIETCAEWVIPYIGDLVGNNPFYEVAGRRRPDVAKTIYYRRRKGTLSMLEELAGDVTGWGAHAVAFFELLGWFQNLEHLRFQSSWAEMRSLERMSRVDGAFDSSSHTVDVRRISQFEGRHNIRNIGFFLWRLNNYPLEAVTARQAALPNDFGYHFSPLGNPAPMFSFPLKDPYLTNVSNEARLAGPISVIDFYSDLKNYAEQFAALAPGDRPPSSNYYGPERSLNVIKDGTPVPPFNILCKDLSTWNRPPAGKVAVDVRLGRLTFAAGEEPAQPVIVDYNYGFSDDIGGGPYDRKRKRRAPSDSRPLPPDTIADPDALNARLNVTAVGPTPITGALTAWNPAVQPRVVIQINDSATYTENLAINLTADNFLVIQAENLKRPTLFGDITVTAAGGLSRLILNGLVVAGTITIRGNLGELDLVHCTLVPGVRLNEDGTAQFPDRPSLVIDDTNVRLRVQIDHCIVGALRVPLEVVSLTVRDSIVDAVGLNAAIAANDAASREGPTTVLERTTVFGRVRLKELRLASEVIFDGRVITERRQAGCVRFSYVPPGSQTPRRYHCQPDLAIEKAIDERLALNPVITQAERDQIRNVVESEMVPSFTARRYGLPSYAQLALRCPEEIRTGAEDGSEMGAFSELKQPQRETNLRIRLEEYLPFGLDAGIIYVT